MEDRVNPEWRVVIRHDPRSRRRMGEREYLFFGAGGTVEEGDLMAPTPLNNQTHEGIVVDALHVHAVDTTALEVEDDLHVRDMEYEDDTDED